LSAILQGVDRRSWILFGLLASFWGASYMFIKIGLDDGVPAAAIVFWRTALAALVLLPFALRLGALAGLRERLWPVAVLALVQVAAPFLLITFGEREISSSLTGILVATAPIFTFMLAFAVDHEERAGGIGLAGVAIGIAGVALLLGVDAGGSGVALAGGLMVVLASLGYALGSYYLKRRFSDAQPVGVVAATMAASALMTVPFVAVAPPDAAPGIGAVAAVSTLGVLGTGISFVIFYTLIARVGAAKASLVAYVAPCFVVLYGVALLGESFTGATAAGLILIVGGSWLAAEGRLPGSRRAGASAPGRELAAGGVDVAPASEAHGRPEPMPLERGQEGSDRLARRAAEA
jgi:drug/metabolite transporter (DMT)-like permease